MLTSIAKKLIFLWALVFFNTNFAFASTSSGTIDATYHYATVCAAGTNCTGGNRINFLPTIGTSGASPITIDDTNGIDGHAWGNNLGWINFGRTGTSTTSLNNSTGAITGYAWSQISGWINMSPTGQGVTINSSGEFTGYAWVSGQSGGWLKFDCTASATSTCVKTDWRPISARTAVVSSGGGGGGGGSIVYNPNLASTSSVQINNTFLNQTGNQDQKTDFSNNFRADLNDSGKVDVVDFNILFVNWGKRQNVDITKTKKDRCPLAIYADVNCDGKIDVLDFNLVLVYWGTYIGNEGIKAKSSIIK